MSNKEIDVSKIESIVAELCIKSNVFLPESIKKTLNQSSFFESSKISSNIINFLIENYKYAQENTVPICQDTGMAIIFLKIGQEVKLVGGSLREAINRGVEKGYREGYLRCSIVSDPIYSRKNTENNLPAIVYTDIVDGDKIEIMVAPKGFGSENMSRLKMMIPSAGEQEIIDFVLETVKLAGSNACPPMVIGIGIGGDFEYVAYLAKKALCRDISDRNIDDRYKNLEHKILNCVNKLGIGVQGLGGEITALAVNIEWYPTHIASLPVAVNIGCHATRHCMAII